MLVAMSCASAPPANDASGGDGAQAAPTTSITSTTSVASTTEPVTTNVAPPRDPPPPATTVAAPTSVLVEALPGDGDVVAEATGDVLVADIDAAPPVDEDGAGGESETDDPLAGFDEVENDEPTFDIGPQVALDVDLARFPVDDAGLGGGGNGGGGNGGGGNGDTASGDQPNPDPSSGIPTAGLSGWAAVDAYLESVLIVPGNSAASLAVSIGGDVVHTAAFGVRDPTRGDAAEPGDRFRIASISKPITAIVAMALVEEGVLGLDDPIGLRLAGYVGLSSVSSGAQQLTLRRLLSHRSGFGKYEATFFRSGADSCVDAARQALSRGVGGGGYTYSNMNYCLAGLLIETFTGLTYEQAAYRYLLTPLGISGMRLPPTFDPGPDEVQHQTTLGRNYMETLGAAGSWIATPSDLVTILDSLDLSTPGFKPLSLETVFQMVVPVGGQYGQRGYGLGLISYGDGRFGHTGTIESTHAMLLNRGDSVTWALTVAGQTPSESTALERIMNRAFEAGGFVTS